MVLAVLLLRFVVCSKWQVAACHSLPVKNVEDQVIKLGPLGVGEEGFAYINDQ
jgi:hypothetical protein